VKLKENESIKLAGIIEELTGLTKKELDSFEDYKRGGYITTGDENGNPVTCYQPSVLPDYELSEAVSYERFKSLMQETDEIIGGGSKYQEDKLLDYFGQVAMNYEDAVAEYEEMLEGDNLPKSYLRLFSDYAGIDLAVIPVFVCVALWQADKRSRMEALVYSRKSSSLGIVLNRYLALVCCMAVPVLLTLLHTVISVVGLYPGMSLSFLGALGEALLWLLPGITAVTALGAFLTELLSPLVAIFAQGIWWYLALASAELVGDISKFALIIRHNSRTRFDVFASQYGDFVWNRWFYLVLSVGVILVTVLIYEWKRRGMRIEAFKH